MSLGSGNVFSSEPFSLFAFTGTGPSLVDYIVTSPLGVDSSGRVGYISDFTFGGSYKYFAFGTSTLGHIGDNDEQELTAVATVPEPSTVALIGIALLSFLGLGVTEPTLLRRRAELSRHF